MAKKFSSHSQNKKLTFSKFQEKPNCSNLFLEKEGVKWGRGKQHEVSLKFHIFVNVIELYFEFYFLLFSKNVRLFVF